MEAATEPTTFDDLVPEPDADEWLDDDGDPFGIGAEYSVFAFRLSALTVAYCAFFAIFAWFRLFYWLWDGPWAAAMAGGYVIAISGAVAAWRAHRRRRSFAALVALLLDGGLVLSLLAPTLGFLVVRYL